ncbi:MAG: hypothetical protein IJV31_12780 [Clostridia bacterium]|nr:hypothetical protein [Clostridia bacterium]
MKNNDKSGNNSRKDYRAFINRVREYTTPQNGGSFIVENETEAMKKSERTMRINDIVRFINGLHIDPDDFYNILYGKDKSWIKKYGSKEKEENEENEEKNKNRKPSRREINIKKVCMVIGFCGLTDWEKKIIYEKLVSKAEERDKPVEL